VTTESELRRAFEAERAALEKWGQIVAQKICARLQAAIVPRKMSEFLKVPAEPRVKNTESFLAKALRRGKQYPRPLENITDKVGVRFVVLLRSELQLVEAAIISETSWYWQKDKDFEQERAQKPHHFDYQSLHYVVKAQFATAQELHIPDGLACEIQVRTLLQHAYAELAHDRTYKPNADIDTETLREVAKSAALIETADDIFLTVNDSLERATAEIQRLHELCVAVYRERIAEPNLSVALSNRILNAYRQALETFDRSTLETFLNENDFVTAKIAERAPISILFRNACILAVYYLVQNGPDLVPRHWPLERTLLEPIYADLGISAVDRL